MHEHNKTYKCLTDVTQNHVDLTLHKICFSVKPTLVQICKHILKLFFPAYPYIPIRFVFKPMKILSNFSSFEDRISFKCQFSKSLHVGVTIRHLHKQMCEHMGISPYIGNPLCTTSLSNVLSHHKSTDHPVFLTIFPCLLLVHCLSSFFSQKVF